MQTIGLPFGWTALVTETWTGNVLLIAPGTDFRYPVPMAALRALVAEQVRSAFVQLECPKTEEHA